MPVSLCMYIAQRCFRSAQSMPTQTVSFDCVMLLPLLFSTAVLFPRRPYSRVWQSQATSENSLKEQNRPAARSSSWSHRNIGTVDSWQREACCDEYHDRVEPRFADRACVSSAAFSTTAARRLRWKTLTLFPLPE